MQPSPESTSARLVPAPETSAKSRRREDLAYQAVTIAAILLVLGSLWLF